MDASASAIVTIAEDRVIERLERGVAGYQRIAKHTVSAEAAMAIRAVVAEDASGDGAARGAEGRGREAGVLTRLGFVGKGYWVTGDADPPSVGPDRRLRSHQTSPPTSTAAARIPNAIQPHCVLLVSVSAFLFEAAAAPAAAAAAGLRPEVVVAATVVVTGAGAATVAVWVRT
jgi:hypothetical protein